MQHYLQPTAEKMKNRVEFFCLYFNTKTLRGTEKLQTLLSVHKGPRGCYF